MHGGVAQAQRTQPKCPALSLGLNASWDAPAAPAAAVDALLLAISACSCS